MKKTFSLTHPKHKPARVIELMKSEVRKYIKRERRRELPENTDFWAVDCKFGFGEEEPIVIHEAELGKYIDMIEGKKCETVYIEIIARAEVRKRKEKKPIEESTEETPEVTD